MEKSSKARSSSRAKTDTELVKQLKKGATDEKLVEAVVRLKPDDPSQIVPKAERMEELTSRLLERVKKESGEVPSRYNVFRNLGSFVVSAHPTFIQHLIDQPEVISIMANHQPGSALIEPIRNVRSRNISQRTTKATPKKRRSATASKISARKPPK